MVRVYCIYVIWGNRCRLNRIYIRGINMRYLCFVYDIMVFIELKDLLGILNKINFE